MWRRSCERNRLSKPKFKRKTHRQTLELVTGKSRVIKKVTVKFIHDTKRLESFRKKIPEWNRWTLMDQHLNSSIESNSLPINLHSAFNIINVRSRQSTYYSLASTVSSLVLDSCSNCFMKNSWQNVKASLGVSVFLPQWIFMIYIYDPARFYQPISNSSGGSDFQSFSALDNCL